jgi:hypothetical protein
MAPGASIVFAGAQLNHTLLDHQLIYMIDNPLADIITNSWSYYADL